MASILTPTSESIAHVAQLLAQGDIVALPTETIYGLFGDATNMNAITKIFAAKQRPADNPLIVHLASTSQIENYASVSHSLERLLIDTFMPGPFTLVLPKKDNIPLITTGGLQTVCIRIPSNQIILDIIQQSGKPLAGPSANTSGKPSPTSANMVAEDLGDKVSWIMDGGPSPIGIESTVAIVEYEMESQKAIIKILRPGFVTADDIQNVVGDKAVVTYNDHGVNQSPGSRYRHYAPKAKVYFFNTQTPNKQENNIIGKKNIAYITTTDFKQEHQWLFMSDIKRYDFGDNPKSSAQKLYELYHQCDKDNIQHIYIQPLPEIDIGYALMNRIKKSIVDPL